MAGVSEFIEGWDFVQILGEGAFGEVKLAVNRETQEAIAVKIIDLTRFKDAALTVRKEVCVHRMLSHDNVIKFYGCRKFEVVHYLYLEYACGGELFDRLEPDVGMPPHEAHRFFKQLICGVQYLHSKGVTHRDLKPENLLLDGEDNLKISDFGFSTVFRNNGQERMLDTVCGTEQYIAPEVLSRRPYKAEPIDVWSCGIILVAMLAGELPWDCPTVVCDEYASWKDYKITIPPWTKIDNLAMSLLRKILTENPVRRATIETITRHQWFTKTFEREPLGLKHKLGSPGESPFRKKTCSGVTLSPPTTISRDSGRFSFSQPEPNTSSFGEGHQAENVPNDAFPGVSFSQPTQLEDMLVNTQMTCTQGSSQTPMQRLVKRMTRFFVKTDYETTLTKLEAVFSELGYRVKHGEIKQHLTVVTTDKRNSQLTFKACVVDMAENILVDFRLSKGDGIEFKKKFIKIREKLGPIINKTPTAPLFALSQLSSQVLSQVSSQP